MVLRRVATALLLVGSAAGCGTDPNVFRVGCSAPVAVSATATLTPTISWSPGCEVGIVTVAAVTNRLPLPGETGPTPLVITEIMWQVESRAATDGPNNLLEPSLSYGRVPRLGVEVVSAKPLVRGGRYAVFLSGHRLTGSTVALGVVEFYPE